MNQEKIGKFIATKRKEKNMTQEELADKLRVNNRTVSRWENGRNMPDLSLFKPLCNELNISLIDLFNGETSNNGDIKDIMEKTIDFADKEIKTKNHKFLRRILYCGLLLIILLGVVLGISDYNKVKMGNDPSFMIRISDGSKSTQYYLGLGYMMERKVGISYKESLSSDLYVRFGLWIATWEVDIINLKPEELYLRSSDNEVTTNIGSYCLTRQSTSTCADTLGPIDMKYNETLSVFDNIISYKLYNSSIKRIDVYKDGVLIKSDLPFDENTIKTDSLKGENIIVISVISEDGNGWYSAKINVK